jgi:hypothetical protein
VDQEISIEEPEIEVFEIRQYGYHLILMSERCQERGNVAAIPKLV